MIATSRTSVLRQTRSSSLRFARASTVPHFGSYARLASSLAVLEQRDGKLNIASLASVAAAQKIGGSVTTEDTKGCFLRIMSNWTNKPLLVLAH